MLSASWLVPCKADLTWNDILLRPQQIAYCIFRKMRVLLVEVIGERKGNHRKPGIVVGAALTLVEVRLTLYKLVVTLLAVNVADLKASLVNIHDVVPGACNVRNGTIPCAQGPDSTTERSRACSP